MLVMQRQQQMNWCSESKHRSMQLQEQQPLRQQQQQQQQQLVSQTNQMRLALAVQHRPQHSWVSKV
jgi:hypothetical protein